MPGRVKFVVRTKRDTPEWLSYFRRRAGASGQLDLTGQALPVLFKRANLIRPSVEAE